MQGFQATVQEKPPALQREHPALQIWKFFPFMVFFASWIRIFLPGLDPQTRLNPDPTQIRNTAFIVLEASCGSLEP
jgi:hypothetical protein